MEELILQSRTSYDKLTEKLQVWLDTLILNVPNLIIASLVVLMAVFFHKYVKRAVMKATSKYANNPTITNLFSNLTTVFYVIIIGILILTIFSLNSTINKFLATAGVLGLAVGLALQDPMTNLFSGISMSVRDLYTIGDLVETNGHFGTIVDIDLRSTKLRLPTGQIVVIPNKNVIQNPLKNYSTSGQRRIDLQCGVSYGDDLEKVENVVLNAISQLDNIDDDQPQEIVFTEFGDSSINFIVRYWLKNPSQLDYLLEKSEGIKAIKHAFNNNDIMIPFPIRTLDFGVKGGEGLKTILKAQSIMSEN
jgi:small conductance mechanosensitive channel